jgi:general secretion pathway protein A
MYLELFKLRELPFRLTPDPSFLYLSKHHARAKAYMESIVWYTDGFVVITGEIGSGKTTLIETFAQELEKDVVVAHINQTQVNTVEFLQAVLVQFGFQPFKMKKAELLVTLNDFLVEQHSAGRRVVLIVDEAQNLTNKVLEEIRMLSGVETTKEKVLRIILAGQPELDEKLNAPELIQLAQRVRLRFHLTALSPDDISSYVLHRLEVAGSQGREIFEPSCYPLIYRYTGGIPRLVNTLCDTAMLAAFAQDRDHVTRAEVQAAIDELHWSEYAERSIRLPARSAKNTVADTQSIAELSDTNERPLGRVIVATNGQTISEHSLFPGRFIIGRTPENDLQIDSKFISRHHAQIITSSQSCVIEDLNSTNGVFLKSKRVRRRVLNDGDVIQLGQHEITYLDERQSGTNMSNEDDDAEPMPGNRRSDMASPQSFQETQALDKSKL